MSFISAATTLLLASQIGAAEPLFDAPRGWDGHKPTAVFHANGRLAWSGRSGDPVFHDNGRPAWDGRPDGSLYERDGRRAEPTCEHSELATSCQPSDVWLGSGLMLVAAPGGPILATTSVAER